MAKQQNPQEPNNVNSTKSNVYTKGLAKDYNDSYVPEGVWINAINAVTNSHLGDTGTIGNEPSNEFCVATDYDVIGIIRRDSSTWVICSTNDTVSEVGIFSEKDCSYTKVVSSTCLGFKKSHLITGAVQYNADCTYTAFLADGLNPDWAINLDNPPYQVQSMDLSNPECPQPIYYQPLRLDCDKARLHYLVTAPCFKINRSVSGGSLFNGSYQVAIAYSINNQVVTNYFALSNVVSIWDHENRGGSIDVEFTSIDTNFLEYQVVLVSTVNEKTTAKIIGYYDTSVLKVHIDNNNDELQSVTLASIAQDKAVYDTSDKMFVLNYYLLRSGLHTKPDFNYQPLANQIITKWVAAEYPSDYYVKGNNETGYMRDEVYSFFIRWVYNTGDKSASYHIPGRPSKNTDVVSVGVPGGANKDILASDPINPATGGVDKWRVYNTAILTGGGGTLPDGAKVVSSGYMSYWESSERYPVKPSIWNSCYYPWSKITNPPYTYSQIDPTTGCYPDYDLCGSNIRHHKFPDDQLVPIYNAGNNAINILGVQFENIMTPLNMEGKPITNIVGYEILRGSRNGNKSIVAKGIINNMAEFNVPNQPGQKGLYQNYPYNSLESDYFLIRGSWANVSTQGMHNDTGSPMPIRYMQDYFSFHTPDFNFRSVYLNPNEIKVYGTYSGTSYGNFIEPYGHPKEKIPSQGTFLGCLILGLGSAMVAMTGRQSVTKGNTLSIDAQSALQSSMAIVAGLGSAAASGSTVLGATGVMAETKVGMSTGVALGYSLPTMSTTDSDISALNPLVKKPGIVSQIIGWMQQLNLIVSVGGFFLAQGFGTAMKAMMELLPFVQYALQYNSHGFYNKITAPNNNNTRRSVKESRFVNSNVQQFDSTYIVNNLYRPNAAIISLTNGLSNPKVADKSRQTIWQNKNWSDPGKNLSFPISSFYAGMKIDLKAQYGQLGSINQIPIGTCVQNTKPSKGKKNKSQVYFGGDVYINRYTEKNSFPLFNRWAFNLPDGADFDYKKYANVPYPRYWATFEELDLNDISITPSFPHWSGSGVGGAIDFIVNVVKDLGKFVTNPVRTISSWVTGPSKKYHLDRKPNDYNFTLKNLLKKTFYIKQAYFYLSVNGVRDFYVESEINLADRDYGTLLTEQFYNPYGYNDLYDLFRSDILSVPEFFKYDFSLSVSKLVTSYPSWASILPATYNPEIAETCFAYYDTRLAYSLQQEYEQFRENWRIFLPNNYRDFDNVINSVKPINRTGAVILFEDAIPTSINGVDELQTTGGVKITIGDAGLFDQPFQSLTNSDPELEYASCQSSRSVINTPYGVFWISQSTGKIMGLFGNKIVDIAMNGMRYWFAENLEYKLVKQYPGYSLIDNPVMGVGCQAVYDSQYEIVYFTKKDYRANVLNPDGTPVPVLDVDTNKFRVPYFRYEMNLTYGTNTSELQDKDVFIVGGDTTGCIYSSGSIGSFIGCVNKAIKSIPGIASVVSNISSTSLSITILPTDPSIPFVFPTFSISHIDGTSTVIDLTNTTTTLVDAGDPRYFEDCSWTVSYDPKIKMWISFHDWHPDLMFSSNNHFFTIRDNEFWKHNNTCTSFGNYYGTNYGWEIEFPVNTGTSVTTIKNIEYYLEVFKYNSGCNDPFHILDGNFDRALIYNTEQISGELDLNIKPKNDPIGTLTFPKINLDSISIIATKEENKYRFNQFWDITKDRGEFSGLQANMFITAGNGYKKYINPAAINYSKSPLERKKFRHYGNRVILRKSQSGAQKMNLKVVNTNETLSPR